MVIEQIIKRHFTRKVLAKLALKEVEIVGMTSIPVGGSWLETEKAFIITERGTSKVRTFSQVLELAK